MARKRTKSVIIDGKRWCIKTCACGEVFQVRNNRRVECYTCKPPIVKPKYRVVSDPCDYPLATGMVMMREELMAGLRLNSFENGMVFSRDKDRFVVDNGKLRKVCNFSPDCNSSPNGENDSYSERIER